MKSIQERYESFVELLRERRRLSEIHALCGWDEQVNLPNAAGPGRGEQLAVLAKVIHERSTAPAFVDELQLLRSSDGLTEDQMIVLRETWREVERALKVPAELVAAIAEAESSTYSQWIEARSADSFEHVRTQLENLLALKCEYADALRGERTRYDAMLDLYEPGLKTGEATEFFNILRPALSELVKSRSGAPRVSPFSATFEKPAQKELCLDVARMMGFDFDRGRLDEAVHPFCNEMGFDDTRMTTRYNPQDFSSAMYGTMHEAGHGLYEQGYLRRHQHTPLSQYCSMALHESQSRLWENMVGRSAEFLRHLFPTLKSRFPAALDELSFDTLYEYVNWVGASLIRVQADEVSYGLHIIIRFELERDLVSGALAADDLPEAWNDKYERYLGIRPADELTGVLQDVHWYTGNFGYFPTYLFGSSYAAQIFAAAAKALPDLRQQIGRGELILLKEWLNQEIHQFGRRYEAKELMLRATGEEPTPEYYLGYLLEKYGKS